MGEVYVFYCYNQLAILRYGAPVYSSAVRVELGRGECAQKSKLK